MINNVVLVSGVQQSDSVIHIHVSIPFPILFPFRLLQNTERSSLCCTIGACWLSVLSIAVGTCPSAKILLRSRQAGVLFTPVAYGPLLDSCQLHFSGSRLFPNRAPQHLYLPDDRAAGHFGLILATTNPGKRSLASVGKVR